MNGRRAAGVLGVGVAGSETGHLVAYQLRFGAAALPVQSTGAHAYFPGLAGAAIGVMAAVLLAGLLLVGMARIAAGRRLDADRAPSFVRLLAGVFTIQLAVYVVQETLEAQLAGVPGASVPDLVLWGTLGQLPAAALAAVALRWLLARVRPALRALRLAPARQPLSPAPLLAPVPVRSWWPDLPDSVPESPLNRRGPPSF